MTAFSVITRCVHGLFKLHGGVTTHALAMIGSLQARLVRSGRVKGSAMTAGTLGRGLGSRALVMATLTHERFLPMEVSRQIIALHVLDQTLDDFAVREFAGFVFVGQSADNHVFRDVLGDDGGDLHVATSQNFGSFGSHDFLLGNHAVNIKSLQRLIMTLGTRRLARSLDFSHLGMTASTDLLLFLLGLVTTDATLHVRDLMHVTSEFKEFAVH